MRNAAIVTGFSTAVALAGLLTACGEGTTGPSEPPPSPSSLHGIVFDGGAGVPGARVEVTARPVAGRVQETSTDLYGSFAFSGVPGDAQFRVTKGLSAARARCTSYKR
jgi:hypothetical protein